jgi:hypothetical protein
MTLPTEAQLKTLSREELIALPEGLEAERVFGPHLEATVVYLMARYDGKEFHDITLPKHKGIQYINGLVTTPLARCGELVASRKTR